MYVHTQVCCRCAPTQKALIVRLLKGYANKRCAAIGDGGNDVAMIQAADTGIGIEGKEGRQARSILRFYYYVWLFCQNYRYISTIGLYIESE